MTSVLLVDDEKNVLTSLSIGLRRHDYTVRQAQSGIEALRIMEKSPCDIVVSDVRMTISELAELVMSRFDKVPIKYEEPLLGDIKLFDVDNNKIKNDLDIKFRDFELY